MRESRRRLNGSSKDQERSKRIRIGVGNGITVTVAGPDLSLDDGIDAADKAKKIMEKGKKENLTAKTISKASAERAAADGRLVG